MPSPSEGVLLRLLEWAQSARGAGLAHDEGLREAALAHAEAVAADTSGAAAADAGAAARLLERFGVAEPCTTFVFTAAFAPPKISAAADEEAKAGGDEGKEDGGGDGGGEGGADAATAAAAGEESKGGEAAAGGSTSAAAAAALSDEAFETLLPLAVACAGAGRVAAALKGGLATHVGVGCAVSPAGRLAVVLHLAARFAQVTEVDGSAERGASGVLSLQTRALATPGRQRSVIVKVMPDSGFAVSSFTVSSQPGGEGAASMAEAGEPEAVAAPKGALFTGAAALVHARSEHSRGVPAQHAAGADIEEDDEGCSVVRVPLSRLYTEADTCAETYVIDVFVRADAVHALDEFASGDADAAAAELAAEPAADSGADAERLACRFLVRVTDHDAEARAETFAASALPSSVAAGMGNFNELVVSVGAGGALPEGFRSLGMPLTLLTTDVRRLPMLAGGALVADAASAGLGAISHVLLISGESAEECHANCPSGYELLPTNLAHDVAAALGALPLPDQGGHHAHAAIADGEAAGGAAAPAEGTEGAAEGGEAAAKEGEGTHAHAEGEAAHAHAPAAEGEDPGGAAAADAAGGDGAPPAAEGEAAAAVAAGAGAEEHGAADAAAGDPPQDAAASDPTHAHAADEHAAAARLALDVYPAAVFLAVMRETGGGAGEKGGKHPGRGHAPQHAGACQHLALAAVASVPGERVNAPGVQLPDGYSLQLVDLAVRCALRGPVPEESDGTERRLARVILVQTASAQTASAAAAAGAGLTVGEYDSETLHERAAAEAAAIAAANAEEYKADRDELLDMYRAAKAEQETLQARSLALQRQLSAVFFSRLNEEAQAKASEAAAKAEGDSGRPLGPTAQLVVAEQNKKFHALLDALALERARVAEATERADAEAAALQARLDDKDARVGQVARALSEFKLEVAKHSVDGQSGKPMPRELIASYEKRDKLAAADVARVQLKNLFVQGQIEKLESAMAKREQLADGLALVDFEQLEIENSTLVEKIDDRNEELAKLRKKTTTAVQTLTHMREKLHFVSADVARLTVELATVERAVSEQRARLGLGKKKREITRVETEIARNQQGFAYADQLAIDYEVRKRAVLQLKHVLEARMREHAEVEAATRALAMV